MPPGPVRRFVRFTVCSSVTRVRRVLFVLPPFADFVFVGSERVETGFDSVALTLFAGSGGCAEGTGADTAGSAVGGRAATEGADTEGDGATDGAGASPPRDRRAAKAPTATSTPAPTAIQGGRRFSGNPRVVW